MDEDLMRRLMMLASMCLAVLCGLGAIALLIVGALHYSAPVIWGAFLLAAATVGSGVATTYFGRKVTGHPLIFTNEAEREVLNVKQRRELRRKRGEVVMERALIDIENEKDNITHRALTAANDPDKPPHETTWTQQKGPFPRSLPSDRDGY